MSGRLIKHPSHSGIMSGRLIKRPDIMPECEGCFIKRPDILLPFDKKLFNQFPASSSIYRYVFTHSSLFPTIPHNSSFFPLFPHRACRFSAGFLTHSGQSVCADAAELRIFPRLPRSAHFAAHYARSRGMSVAIFKRVSTFQK